MKKTIAVLAFSIFFVVFLYLRNEGRDMRSEEDPNWILSGVWGASDRNGNSETLDESEQFFFRSMQPGASKQDDILEYFEKNKCRDNSVKCYMVLSVGANLLLDDGRVKDGLKLAIHAYDLINELDVCPAAYELVVINYKLKQLGLLPDGEASQKAKETLDKIRLKGGIANSLRITSCQTLRDQKPAYFNEYAAFVSKVMRFAGGNYLAASSKINEQLK